MAKRTKKTREETKRVRVAADRLMGKEKHDKLVERIFEIISPGIINHQTQVNKYCGLLISLAAMPIADNVDKAKAEAYALGESTVVGDTRYPKALGHINSVAISIMQVLFPARQMYGSVEVQSDKQRETSGLVAAMNIHAKQFKHYTNLSRVITDSLALNLGIAINTWDRETAKFGKIKPSQSNVTSQTQTKTVIEGTKIRHSDPLNTILQPGISAEDYQMEAHYYATIEQVDEYDLLRRAVKGEVVFSAEMRGLLRKLAFKKDMKSSDITGNKEFYAELTKKYGFSSFGSKLGLYNNRPNMHRPISANVENKVDIKAMKSFDFEGFCSDGKNINYEETRPDCCNELMTVVMRALPEDLGFSRDEDSPLMTRIYEVKILNGSYIIGIKEIGTTHGMMNIAITRPLSELSRNNSLALSEKLLPFQEASSSLLNTFIRKARGSANNGMTYALDKLVSSNQIIDPATGFVPVDMEEMKKLGLDDIRKVVHTVGGDAPDQSALVGMETLTRSMQDVVPTDAIDQMAQLNRPVQHQSKRLAELQNLHVWWLSRIIHEELMMPTTHMHTQDLLSFQKEINIIGPDGALQTIDPSVFEEVDLDVAVSDGMRGLDTLAIADRVEKILQYAFQSRRVQNDIDVIAMTNYLLQMDGANIDLNMFRYENEFDKLSTEAKEQAFAMLQAAAAEQQQAPA